MGNNGRRKWDGGVIVESMYSDCRSSGLCVFFFLLLEWPWLGDSKALYTHVNCPRISSLGNAAIDSISGYI